MATSISLPLDDLVSSIHHQMNRAVESIKGYIGRPFFSRSGVKGNGNETKSVKNGQDYDSLLKNLDEVKHLPPSLIRQYFGEGAVLPLLFVDDAYMGESGRKVGKSNFYHFLNTIIRPDYWELGFSNNELPKIISIATHDAGEDLADSIVGNYAITRINGELFGSGFEGSSQAITNFRGTLYKQLESGLHVPTATPNEVTKKLNELKIKAGDTEEQLEAYADIINGLNMYINVVPSLKWKQKDKDEATDIARGIKRKVEYLKAYLIPKKTIEQDSEEAFETLKDYANDRTSLEQCLECQIPFDIPSVLMHNLGHLQYRGSKGSYLGDLLRYGISHTTTSDKIGLVTMLTKPQENVDNLRIEVDNSVLKQHMEYDKSMNISTMGGIYIQHLGEMPEDSDLAYRVFRFHKSELLQRVITDIGKSTLNRDSIFDEHRDWLQGRFEAISNYVGDDAQSYAKQQLKHLAFSSDPKTVESSIQTLRVYGALTGDIELTKVVDSAAKRLKKSKLYTGKLLI